MKAARIFDGAAGGLLGAASRCMSVLNDRPGPKRVFTKSVTRVHVALYRLSGGRLGTRAGAPSLLLTVTGRKTGRPRTIAIFYLPDGDRQVLVASYGGDAEHPQWYRNLMADPVATVRIGREGHQVRARVATATERSQLWPRLMRIWPSFDTYQARTERVLPVVILERC